MNKPQLLKAMAAAKIEAVEVSGAGASLEVTVRDDKAMRAFGKKVARWGGYRTGWGGWVLQAKSGPAKGDFNDRSSRHHY